jgi:hypothetical protein
MHPFPDVSRASVSPQPQGSWSTPRRSSSLASQDPIWRLVYCERRLWRRRRLSPRSRCTGLYLENPSRVREPESLSTCCEVFASYVCFQRLWTRSFISARLDDSNKSIIRITCKGHLWWRLDPARSRPQKFRIILSGPACIGSYRHVTQPCLTCIAVPGGSPAGTPPRHLPVFTKAKRQTKKRSAYISILAMDRWRHRPTAQSRDLRSRFQVAGDLDGWAGWCW